MVMQTAGDFDPDVALARHILLPTLITVEGEAREGLTKAEEDSNFTALSKRLARQQGRINNDLELTKQTCGLNHLQISFPVF